MQTLKLSLTQFYAPFSYFLLMTKYLPVYPILEDPQLFSSIYLQLIQETCTPKHCNPGGPRTTLFKFWTKCITFQASTWSVL